MTAGTPQISPSEDTEPTPDDRKQPETWRTRARLNDRVNGEVDLYSRILVECDRNRITPDDGRQKFEGTFRTKRLSRTKNQWP